MSGVGTQEGIFRALASDPTLSARGNKRMQLVEGVLFFAGNPAGLCPADVQGFMGRNLAQYKSGLRVPAKRLMPISNAIGLEEAECSFRKRGDASWLIQGLDAALHRSFMNGWVTNILHAWNYIMVHSFVQ